MTGERLVSAKRPGMELVVAAHKSVAELGVLGTPEDMHAIMDAERDATHSYLDDLTKERGGRRGRGAVPTETSGLVYAHARHATTRAGDPGPHDSDVYQDDTCHAAGDRGRHRSVLLDVTNIGRRARAETSEKVFKVRVGVVAGVSGYHREDRSAGDRYGLGDRRRE